MAASQSIRPCPQCGEPIKRKDNRHCSHRCAALAVGSRPPDLTRPVADRFWEKVDKTTTPEGCWEWTGSRKKDGYGRIGRGGIAGGSVNATRVAWEITNGPIPPGMFICHRCDNPPCVRPDHLFLGTPEDNVVDSMSKGRWIKGERVGGSKLTEADVRAIRAKYASAPRFQRGLARAIAAEYGITISNVSAIVRRESWAHVE